MQIYIPGEKEVSKHQGETKQLSSKYIGKATNTVRGTVSYMRFTAS